ncbi:DUF6542 domain-containing protein (plasmid) [Streptomyces sp. QH1-20]|uniref:DUF6542 domain-containing protein n=1 Tax=Streptomyces sp. QH1-20 TaxID=3240934 RepID=UPI0035182A73
MTDIWGQQAESGCARRVNPHADHTRPYELRVPQHRRGATEARPTRTGGPTSPPSRHRSGRPSLAVLPLVAGPLFGALVSDGQGPLFVVCAAAGAAGATWLSSRAGAWWTVTAAPVVVLLVAMSVRVALGSDTSTGAALATGALKWSANAFIAMLAALAAALAVPLVRRTRGKGKHHG